MRDSRLDRLLDFLANVDLVAGLLWLGLATLSITLLLMMRTRWGRTKPLRKCLVLSLLAHVLLAGYATTVHIVASAPLQTNEPVIRVKITDKRAAQQPNAPDAAAEKKPWESFVHDSVLQPTLAELARADQIEIPELQRQPRSEQTGVGEGPSLDPLAPEAAAQPRPDALPRDNAPAPAASPAKTPESIDAPDAQRREGVRAQPLQQRQIHRRAHADTAPLEPQRQHPSGLPFGLLDQRLPAPRLTSVSTTPDPRRLLEGLRDSPGKSSRGEPAEWPTPQLPSPREQLQVRATPGPAPSTQDGNPLRPLSVATRGASGVPGGEKGDPIEGSSFGQVPAVYRLRIASDRSRLALLRGATSESEQAVKRALAWLAANQASDGYWDARTHGAGRERFVAGRDRQGAGIQADTGITGLALLAFLASGHTHQSGHYHSNVRRGLQYLLNSQAADGNLGGGASTYAFMYCHAMAAFALSEAYGMTGDPVLRGPVERAVAYTVAAQDPSGGGWRYKPADPGDTSQLGWQLMALKSAELAGIPIPQRCREGAWRFLGAVSSGQYGGLAAYRPTEWATRPMTAEALVCRQFLGMPADHPSAREAGDDLLGDLPTNRRPNLYYWYYGTLGMYHLQGGYWDRWNDALQRTLLASQRTSGSLAGSWDPETVWGGYGGRVYTTALATLCLEVYYRYLPLYLDAGGDNFPPQTFPESG